MESFDESMGRMVALVGAAARESAPKSAFCIGKVLQAGNGTLRVQCGGLQLGKNDIWLSGGLSCSWTEDDGSELYLRAGDRIILLSDDGQDYYLLAKAVRA